MRLASFLAAYAAYVAFLHAVDGPWKRWEHGRLVDKWTVLHAAWGALAKAWGITERELLALSAVQITAETVVDNFFPEMALERDEPWTNYVTDSLATVLAWRMS